MLMKFCIVMKIIILVKSVNSKSNEKKFFFGRISEVKIQGGPALRAMFKISASSRVRSVYLLLLVVVSLVD